METRGIKQRAVGDKRIGIILTRKGRAIQHGLEIRRRAFPNDIPADNTVCRPIYIGDDVHLVFFRPINVNSSSNSLTSKGNASGWGGSSGKRSAWAFIQLATV